MSDRRGRPPFWVKSLRLTWSSDKTGSYNETRKDLKKETILLLDRNDERTRSENRIKKGRKKMKDGRLYAHKNP